MVTDMVWSADGQKICIIYEDGKKNLQKTIHIPMIFKRRKRNRKGVERLREFGHVFESETYGLLLREKQ